MEYRSQYYSKIILMDLDQAYHSPSVNGETIKDMGRIDLPGYETLRSANENSMYGFEP